MNQSELEAKFLYYWNILRPDFDITAEYRFDKLRRWRFDYAIPLLKIAIELQGGIWNNGKHSRGIGYINDCDKHNAAIEQGWLILSYTSHHLDNDPNAVIEQICRVIMLRSADSGQS